MNKIEGTIVAASRLEGGEQATCGIVVWTTAEHKAEMERWECNGLVVVERKADHDAREAEVKRLREESKILRDGFTGYRETMRCEMVRLIAEVERLRDANLQRVAEGMSRWCAPQSPQSPHLDRLGMLRVEALRENIRQLKTELESATSRPPMNPHLVAIADALEYAKRKHPFFARFPMEEWLPRQTSVALAEARANLADGINMNSVTGSDVLECEIAEARDDYAHGDFAACLEELAQCGAVVVRMMEAVQELMDGQDKAGEEPIK